MVDFMLAVLAGMGAFFRCRSDLALQILALRQHVAVLKRKRPQPSLNSSDRLFWVLLRQFWASWKSVPIIVKPYTVVAWHRAGFRWYWRWKSRRRRRRPRVTIEIRELIVRERCTRSSKCKPPTRSPSSAPLSSYVAPL
jgi:hypothetical protein